MWAETVDISDLEDTVRSVFNPFISFRPERIIYIALELNFHMYPVFVTSLVGMASSGGCCRKAMDSRKSYGCECC